MTGKTFEIQVQDNHPQRISQVRKPIAALFRKNENWAVFIVKEGRARLTLVQIGQRNNRVAQVISGLLVGDQVVLHPSNRVQDGVPLSEREIPETSAGVNFDKVMPLQNPWRNA